MSFEARINASRKNGKKSRGPITLEGKGVSSQNAEHHALLPQSIGMEGEDKSRFQAMLARFIARHRPQTGMAKWRQMASWKWRPPVSPTKSAQSLIDRSHSLNALNR